jgi:hypothetical protein
LIESVHSLWVTSVRQYLLGSSTDITLGAQYLGWSMVDFQCREVLFDREVLDQKVDETYTITLIVLETSNKLVLSAVGQKSTVVVEVIFVELGHGSCSSD